MNWIKTSERLPQAESEVLTWSKNYEIELQKYFGLDQNKEPVFHIDDDLGQPPIVDNNVYCWMPLPDKWMSVKNGLPNDNDLVIVRRGDGRREIELYRIAGNFHHIIEQGQGVTYESDDAVTHFAPLPEPPKE